MDLAKSYGGSEAFLTTMRDDPLRVYDDALSLVSGIGAAKKFRGRGVEAQGRGGKRSKHLIKSGALYGKATQSLDSFALFNKMFNSEATTKATDFMFDTLPQKSKVRLMESALGFNQTQRNKLSSLMNTKGAKGKKAHDYFIDNKIYGSHASMLTKAEALFEKNNGRVDRLLDGFTDNIYADDATNMVDYLIKKEGGGGVPSAKSKERMFEFKELRRDNNVYTPSELQKIRKTFDQQTRPQARKFYGEDPHGGIDPVVAKEVENRFEDRDAVMGKIEKFGEMKAAEIGNPELANIGMINKDVNTSRYAATALDQVMDRSGSKHLFTMVDYMVMGGTGGIGYSAGANYFTSLALSLGGVALRRALDSPMGKSLLAQQLSKISKTSLRKIVDEKMGGEFSRVSKKHLERAMRKVRQDMGPMLMRSELARKRGEQQMINSNRFPSAN